MSDGVTWFFARGPRRTLSTARSYYGDSERRVMLWTGNVDEIHDVEGIVRGVAGGVGAMVWRYPATPRPDLRIMYDGSAVPPGSGRTPSEHAAPEPERFGGGLARGGAARPDLQLRGAATCDHTPVHEWDEVDAFIKAVARRGGPQSSTRRGWSAARSFSRGPLRRVPRRPGLPTVSGVFYTPGAINNGALPYSAPFQITDELLGLLRLETYAVPPALRPLNPPGATGSATFRRWTPEDRDRGVHLYGKEMEDGYDSRKTHREDQINCVLRAVRHVSGSDERVKTCTAWCPKDRR